MFELPNFPLLPAVVVQDGLAHSGESKRGGHQLALSKECDRAWALKYDIGVERAEVPPLDDKVPAWALGTVVHQWLANYYAQQLGVSVLAPNAAAEKRAAELGYPQAAKPASDLALEFVRFVEREKPQWRVVSVEPQIECDFGAAGVFTSGADIVFRDDSTGELIIVDWKTAGRLVSNPTYEYSSQYLRYRMILHRHATLQGLRPDWGKVFVGLIPTGKTNRHKRALIECPFYPSMTARLVEQTRDDLLYLQSLEADPEAALQRPKVGQWCHGPYSGCPYRREWCFNDGQTK